MQLCKEIWTKEDGEQFQKYLLSFSKGEEKGAWEKRIVNTALPAIAVPSTEVDKIVRGIAKGNLLSFLNLRLRENHTNILINGKLIGKIRDFSVMEKYLYDFDSFADNWSATDSIKFSFRRENKPLFFDLATRYLRDSHTFVRRQGVVILLKMTAFEEYADGILSAATSLYSEQEYYVNMANAWLVAECFVKFRDKTLAILRSDDVREKINRFTLNKAVEKCRDSYRVSAEDKAFLLSLRKKPTDR